MPVLRPEVDAYVWRATGRDLRWGQYGDFESLAGRQRGCTLTIGARASSVYIRIYDKGREMMGKDAEAPDDLRRAEVEFSPASKLEEIEAVMWPVEKFWGVNAATRGLANFLNISQPQIFDRIYKEPTTAERRKIVLCDQYGTDVLEIFRQLYPGTDPTVLQNYVASQKDKARRSRRRSA
jgi:DNA relaxase NicK